MQLLRVGMELVIVLSYDYFSVRAAYVDWKAHIERKSCRKASIKRL